MVADTASRWTKWELLEERREDSAKCRHLDTTWFNTYSYWQKTDDDFFRYSKQFILRWNLVVLDGRFGGQLIFCRKSRKARSTDQFEFLFQVNGGNKQGVFRDQDDHLVAVWQRMLYPCSKLPMGSHNEFRMARFSASRRSVLANIQVKTFPHHVWKRWTTVVVTVTAVLFCFEQPDDSSTRHVPEKRIASQECIRSDWPCLSIKVVWIALITSDRMSSSPEDLRHAGELLAQLNS